MTKCTKIEHRIETRLGGMREDDYRIAPWKFMEINNLRRIDKFLCLCYNNYDTF